MIDCVCRTGVLCRRGDSVPCYSNQVFASCVALCGPCAPLAEVQRDPVPRRSVAGGRHAAPPGAPEGVAHAQPHRRRRLLRRALRPLCISRAGATRSGPPAQRRWRTPCGTTRRSGRCRSRATASPTPALRLAPCLPSACVALCGPSASLAEVQRDPVPRRSVAGGRHAAPPGAPEGVARAQPHRRRRRRDWRHACRQPGTRGVVSSDRDKLGIRKEMIPTTLGAKYDAFP